MKLTLVIKNQIKNHDCEIFTKDYTVSTFLKWKISKSFLRLPKQGSVGRHEDKLF